jgi:F-type H+-transporting ATPase subunit b
MLIDWFTVGAQVLNFLILVWLLKRFLYRPILDAIDAREERIAKELADAGHKKNEAEQAREGFESKSAAFDKERAALLSKATEAANTERQRLLDVARTEALSLSTKQQKSLQSEVRELHREITRRTCQEVFSIARKTLADLAGATLEERMVAIFIDRLRAISGDEKKTLTVALQTRAQAMRVRSTFALPAEQQAAIKDVVQELLGAGTAVTFETAAELVSGIELSTDGHKVAWSIAEYLLELEGRLGELLEAKSPQGAVPEKGRTDAD